MHPLQTTVGHKIIIEIICNYCFGYYFTVIYFCSQNAINLHKITNKHIDCCHAVVLCLCWQCWWSDTCTDVVDSSVK